MDPLTDDILVVLTLYQADPLLLLSACKFTKVYLRIPLVLKEYHIVENKLSKLENCTRLLLYLGDTSFPATLKVANEYENIDLDSKDCSLSDLSNPLMHQLFIAIIEIIQLMSEDASNTQNLAYTLFQGISDVLNESQREKFLFDCLEVPNEEVKLALVSCINQVPLRELDIDEIHYLMKAVNDSKNIGAGKTEFILSTILWIFTKLILDKEGAAAQSF